MCQNKICLVYQYLLFNADRLKDNKRKSLDRLKRSKDFSADDFVKVYSDIVISEFFEKVTDDLFTLLSY